jgi:hypothetical protein
MKVLLLLMFSLAAPAHRQVPPPVSPVQANAIPKPPRKGGRWYFADSGHAVYCYGPVRFIPMPEGGLQRVATLCQGSKPIVPLRD